MLAARSAVEIHLGSRLLLIMIYATETDVKVNRGISRASSLGPIDRDNNHYELQLLKINAGFRNKPSITGSGFLITIS